MTQYLVINVNLETSKTYIRRNMDDVNILLKKILKHDDFYSRCLLFEIDIQKNKIERITEKRIDWNKLWDRITQKGRK